MTLPVRFVAETPAYIAPRGIVLDAIGRIGHHQVRSRAVEEAGHVFGLGRVAAEQTVGPESQVSGCVIGSAGSSGTAFSSVRLGSRPIIQQAPQLAGIEAGQGEVKAHLLEIV